MSGIASTVRQMIVTAVKEGEEENWRPVMIVNFKQRILETLNSVLEAELEDFEDEKATISIVDATAKTNGMLNFYRFIMGINNIDL